MTREEKLALLATLSTQRDALNAQIATLYGELYPSKLSKYQSEQAHAAKIRQQQQDGA